MEQQTPKYEQPSLTDYGQLKDLTANNAQPVVVDVPQGTPVGVPGGIVGDPPNMS